MAAPNFIQLARQAAIRARINPDAFVKQISAESGFNPRARSPAGAQGIAQIMPSTARGWGVNPNDPVAALRAAAQHMGQYERQTGSLKGALEMYNLGHTAPDSQLPAETRNYIAKITGGGGAPVQAVQSASPAAPGGMNPRTQLALSLLGFGGAGAAAGGDPLAVALQQASQASPTRTAAAPAGSPSSSPAGGGGKGVASFEGKPVAAWIKPWLQKARALGWQGSISSGYRSYADQARIYASGVRPAAKPGTSNHEFTAFPGGAVDVTNAPQLAQILQRLHAPLQWAGAKDPVHFSHPHAGSY